MTVVLELPPEIEVGLLAQAQAEGLNVSEYVQNLVRERVATKAAARGITTQPAYELPPEEWVRQFEAWTRSHMGRQLPVLSDEAMSRESIYADRGL